VLATVPGLLPEPEASAGSVPVPEVAVQAGVPAIAKAAITTLAPLKPPM
jgi:hypothetical protein